MASNSDGMSSAQIYMLKRRGITPPVQVINNVEVAKEMDEVLDYIDKHQRIPKQELVDLRVANEAWQERVVSLEV